jgi:amino acid adenylation domain-containing protein
MNSENVLSLVCQQVRNCGSRIAVIAEDETVSYLDLWTRALAVANYLSPLVTQGQVIGVLTTRSVDMLAAMLGIWQAGCAYLPLDANDPPERYLRILEIAGCGIVLTHPELMASPGSLASKNAHRTVPDFVDLRRLASFGTIVNTMPLQLAGDHLAYVMFTSGSSGTPKGVEVEHHSLVSFLCAFRDLIGFSESDCFLAVTTIGFDVSIPELFIPLITGGTVLLRDQDLLQSPERLATTIREHEVTVFQAVATIWSLLVAEHTNLPRLRVAMNMGEAISNELAAQLIPLADEVWNMYGPTEATVYASACRITLDVLGEGYEPGLSAPIGRQLSNAYCVILDPAGKPVAQDENGELYIAGAAVARGYRHAPELNARAFVQLAGVGRAYRTGDIAARRKDGELLYFGRIDDQFKVRGLRVEPGEVRAALLAHPGVLEAAVTWYTKPNNTRAVVAVVVAARGCNSDQEELRIWLSSRLRPQMIPEHLLFLPELPRLPNKKIDYGRIRQEALISRVVAQPAATPREPTPTESKLITIWQDILGVLPVFTVDHFLGIGGDSLGAMRVLARVERDFGVLIAIGKFFEHLQLEQLARLIDSEGTLSSLPNFVFPLHQEANEHPLFFSDADLRMASRGRWTIPCPLYGIAYWAQESQFLNARSIADLARTHVVAIRQLQAYGPYRLGGQGFGGIAALEIARQLEAQGEQVEFLFLLNPRKPGAIDPDNKLPAQPTPPSLLRKLGNWLRRNRLYNWINYQAHHIGRVRNDNPAAASTLPRSHWPAFWGKERSLRTTYVARPCSAAVLAFFTEPGPTYHSWAQLLGQGGRCQLLPPGENDIYSDTCRALWTRALQEKLALCRSFQSIGATNELR